MVGWLAGVLNRMLARAARDLPAERRHWVDAVRAEADQVPAPWPRLAWLAGGFWLVAREGGMARKIGYWTGTAGIAAAAAWVIWLSWRTAAPADPEGATDRVRVLVGAVTLAGLPWVARGRGWFGPVADSGAARLARIGGCAAICGMGLSIVRADRQAGFNGAVGTGQLSWPREAAGLAILVAAIAAPLILRARRPRTSPETYVVILTILGMAALFVAPIQAFAVGCAAMVLAATSRRSPVTAATWTTGLIASLPTAAAACVLPFTIGKLFTAVFIVAVVAAAAGGGAGAVAARLVIGTGNPDELRAARMLQGALAGAIAGAAGGLVAATLSPILGEMMVAGLVAGLAGGMAGAALAADRRARSIAAEPGGSAL
jgi:hypothetical protein